MSALLVIFWCAIALARCQDDYHQSSQNAAILKDSRYLSGDGTFGSAYSQEDGVEFKEESDVYGNRRGSFSYIDPTGQRRTVIYTAGVNGFQASSDHIPSQASPTVPPPEYMPLPQYNPPDYQLPQVQTQASNPLRPHHYQPIQQPYESQYKIQKSINEPPMKYRQLLTTHKIRPRLQIPSHLDSYLEYPVPQLRHESKYKMGSVSQYQAVPGTQIPTRYYYNELTTPVAKKLYSPGKLDFNRTPDGFSYTFSKN